MAKDADAATRVTEIVALLRPGKPRKYPESLTAAAIAGDLERMQLFVDRGANIEERSVGHASPLGAACAIGQLQSARWLIAHGAVLDPPGAAISPLQSALGKANCEAAALLLDAGVPIERAAWGVVAASSLGRLDVLRWLLGRGLDLDRSYPGVGLLRERALQGARKGGGDELARFLKGEIDLGPAPAAPPPTPPIRAELPRAALEDRPALLREALELVRAGGSRSPTWIAAGPFAPSQRQLLLSFASGTGITEIVTAMLDAGTSPDFAPEGTPPPLYAAAAEALVDIVGLLLARGAAPDGGGAKGWLALAGAAQSGEPEVVRQLLEAGANPRVKPPGGLQLQEFARGPYKDDIRAILEQAAGKGNKSEQPSSRSGRRR